MKILNSKFQIEGRRPFLRLRWTGGGNCQLSIVNYQLSIPIGCLLAVGLLLIAGCSGESGVEKLRQAMYNQPKYKPFGGSAFFGDGRAMRPVVPGTVAQGQLREDTGFYAGKTAEGEPVSAFPFVVTREVLERGRERYDIFCSPCHDRAGTGQGMVVRRGFRRPSSYHIDRLREVPVGYIYDVITNGFGTMYSYASRISPEDRWAIVAYVRALQFRCRA